MAGVSGRYMVRSFARAAGQFHKAASGEIGVAAAAAPRSKSFFMESRRGFGRLLPRELACVQSLLPLHNATASARMVSHLCSSTGTLLQDLRDIT